MVDEEQVAKARAWLYEALDEVLADNPPGGVRRR